MAKNIEVSPAILLALSTDQDGDVREAVAKHPRTPPAVLKALSEDADKDVRLASALKGENNDEPA